MCWVNGFVSILLKFGWELCLIFVFLLVCFGFDFLVFLCLIFWVCVNFLDLYSLGFENFGCSI